MLSPFDGGAAAINPVKIVIAGYYGCGNIGDDALLAGFLEALGDLPVQAVVLSGNPDETLRAVGVRAIPRRDKAALRTELGSAEALVFAGGGLLQDATSFFSINYYASLVHLAKKMGKRVLLLAQGVGPITSFFGRRAAAMAVRLCDVVSVRDAQSVQALRGLGIKRPIHVTADLAWLVRPAPAPEGGFQLGGMKTVALAPRPWGSRKLIAQAFGGFAQVLFKNQYVPVLVEMDRTMDTAILDAIAKMHGGRCPDIRNVASPSEMLTRIRRMHAVVAMRLHAGLFAAAGGTAPLMIAYDPKVATFASLLGMPAALPLEGLSARGLWQAFEGFERSRAHLNKQAADRAAEQTTLARRNIDIMVESIPALAGVARN